MDYAAFLIRRTRLEKNWSQDGLCRGICTASYLSKIEQGKAKPSDEVVRLLLERLGIAWNGAEDGSCGKVIDEAYDLLFSEEICRLHRLLEGELWAKCESSPWGLDWLLISRSASNGEALDAELEPLMDSRQLSLQRILQGRCEEAIRLNPCSHAFLEAGDACYSSGDVARAIELMHKANTLAAEEGCVKIMLQARIVMGMCYSNLQDFESMERHFAAARRLARSLGEQSMLDSIDYNTAATCLEAGRFQQAMEYFETLKECDSRLSLHKLAICCEKLGRKQEALDALARAKTLPDHSPEQVESEMCRTVELRLTQPQYLDSKEYGESLLRTFSLCRRHESTGFCLFHMPWMIEWYEHCRQYKQVAALLLEFPYYGKNHLLSPGKH